jgi:hypothetical protein
MKRLMVILGLAAFITTPGIGAAQMEGLARTQNLTATATATGFVLSGSAYMHTTCNVRTFEPLPLPAGLSSTVFLAVSYFQGKACGQMDGFTPMKPFAVTTSAVPKSVTVWTSTGAQTVPMTGVPHFHPGAKSTGPGMTTGQGMDEQHPGGTPAPK